MFSFILAGPNGEVKYLYLKKKPVLWDFRFYFTDVFNFYFRGSFSFMGIKNIIWSDHEPKLSFHLTLCIMHQAKFIMMTISMSFLPLLKDIRFGSS